MVSLRKDIVFAILIPVTYSIGVLAFLLAFPPETQTLSNFISFTSSLSTILMVLVVIVSNALQRKEMENNRILQNQPLPTIITPEDSYMEELRFWISYPNELTKIDRRIKINFSLENIGNGPAIAVEIIPELMYWDKKGKTYSATPAWMRIGLLKENEKKEVGETFTTSKGNPSMAACMMGAMFSDLKPCGGHGIAFAKAKFTIFYRNFLGAIFKQVANFNLFFYDDDEDNVKSCLKLFKTANIDFARDIERANTLLKSKNYDELDKIYTRINEKLSMEGGCMKLEIAVDPELGTFSIQQISMKEYQKTMKNGIFERTVGALKEKEHQSKEVTKSPNGSDKT